MMGNESTKRSGKLKRNSAGEVYIEAYLHGKVEVPVDFTLNSCSVLSQIDRKTAVQLGIKGHPQLIVAPLTGAADRLDYLTRVDMSILGFRTSVMVRVNEGLPPKFGADITAIYNIMLQVPENEFSVTDPVAAVEPKRKVYASQMFNELMTHVGLLPSDLLLFSQLPASPTKQLEAEVCEDYLSNSVPLRGLGDSIDVVMTSEAMLASANEKKRKKEVCEEVEEVLDSFDEDEERFWGTNGK